jgi:flagellar biosynthesis/type III secretory pathway protein FliH
MNIRNLRNTIGISLIALTFVFAAASVSNAQYGSDRRDRDNNNNQQGDRYQVRHGNYRTDQQGVNILQQAVNQGYQQGFQAGQEARSNRRRNSNNNWRSNSVYRSGDTGYDSHVDRRQYQYYFQQGFQKGYDDGYNSRNRYGSNNTVLGTFLNQILGARRY